MVDIIISVFLLSIGFPVLYLSVKNLQKAIKKLKFTIKGTYSFVGLLPCDSENQTIGKPGIIGLAHIAKAGKLSQEAIKKLNDDYIRHYSLSLDVDIFLKFLFRKKNAD
jgi:hypothetical protein